jgi:pyruvate,water dikinase
MIPYILPLSAAQADLETVGGKGSSLASMIRSGLPVPDGFHITTESYRCFVGENHLQARILAALERAELTDPDSLETVSQEISLLFEAGEMPAAIAAAISEAYIGLKQVPVAVRSSATAEDLPDASFAGQQETYLNISGTPQVLAAVKKCWASLWTSRAIAYRLKNHIDQTTIALAVVVQELVFADAAGILFTANPVNGKRTQLVINAAWGLGEAVVSGAVTPDTLTVNKKNGRLAERQIAEKLVMTVRTADGTREEPVPVGKQKKPALRAAQVAELTRLGAAAEDFFGMPMDVEWTLADGKFAIVQARPITALPLDWQVPDPKAVYARGSLAEHIPSPVTPLFATLGLRIANEATARMWDRLIGKDSKGLLAGDGFYLPLNGYVFGGIRMRGKEAWTILKMSISQIGPIFHGSVARWHTARQQFAAVVEPWQKVQVQELTPAQLIEGVHTLFSAACVYFTDIQNTLPAASSSEVMFTRLYNSLIRRKGDPEATVFLLGFESLSTRAEKSLHALASHLRQHPALAEYVLHTPLETLQANMQRPAAPAGLDVEAWQMWQHGFQDHLQQYGQTAYEFDFANPTPLETPGPMLEAIRGYLSGKGTDPGQRQQAAAAKRETATNAVLARTRWPLRNWFRRLLRWAQETNPMREDSIFEMGMAHPLIRRLLAELDRRLMAGGAIAQAGDIYWLEEGELMQLVDALEQGRPLENMAERIPARKEQWQSRFKIMPPVMLPEKSGWNKLIHGAETITRNGKTVLKGVGTSSGSVTAPACVVFGPEDFKKIRPGDVLVAVTTTPAWTPLFAVASAVVTDIGGPLSHSSIVAREYGIPAVMAVRSATRTIQSGQMITVDGAAGTVTLES